MRCSSLLSWGKDSEVCACVACICFTYKSEHGSMVGEQHSLFLTLLAQHFDRDFHLHVCMVYELSCQPMKYVMDV